MSAPDNRRHLTHSALPTRAAMCSGLCPAWTDTNIVLARSIELLKCINCSSVSSQHDRGSRFPCPRVEQFTVVCHIIVVTVDFQTTFKDVLVCDLVLMALLTFLFFFSVYRTCLFCVLRVLAVFGLNATLILSLIIIIIIIIIVRRYNAQTNAPNRILQFKNVPVS